MSNISTFLGASGGGAGVGGPSSTQFLIGSGSDQTATFSPTANDLEVGDLIFVTLIGGGGGGDVRGVNGTPQTHSGLGGDAGEMWQGYYELTSTSDITMTAGRGGAGGTRTFTSNQTFTVTGTTGNASTLTQDSTVILSSDNSVTTTYISPSWAGLTVNAQNDNDKFLFAHDTSLTVTAHGIGSAKYHSPLTPRRGSGSGGGGGLVGTFGASGTITGGTGGAGLVIINW